VKDSAVVTGSIEGNKVVATSDTLSNPIFHVSNGSCRDEVEKQMVTLLAIKHFKHILACAYSKDIHHVIGICGHGPYGLENPLWRREDYSTSSRRSKVGA